MYTLWPSLYICSQAHTMYIHTYIHIYTSAKTYLIYFTSNAAESMRLACSQGSREGRSIVSTRTISEIILIESKFPFKYWIHSWTLAKMRNLCEKSHFIYVCWSLRDLVYGNCNGNVKTEDILCLNVPAQRQLKSIRRKQARCCLLDVRRRDNVSRSSIKFLSESWPRSLWKIARPTLYFPRPR